MAQSISKSTEWTRFILVLLVTWWQIKILTKLQLFWEPPQIKFHLIAFQLHINQTMVCASGFDWPGVGNPHCIAWRCRTWISVAFLTVIIFENILLKAENCNTINMNYVKILVQISIDFINSKVDSIRPHEMCK